MYGPSARSRQRPFTHHIVFMLMLIKQLLVYSTKKTVAGQRINYKVILKLDQSSCSVTLTSGRTTSLFYFSFPAPHRHLRLVLFHNFFRLLPLLISHVYFLIACFVDTYVQRIIECTEKAWIKMQMAKTKPCLFILKTGAENSK